MTGGGGPSVVIHAHFYQPPREDPWLDALEREPGAAPFHDWNERIERECYRTVTAARLPDARGRIRRIVNTLTAISFNVGPTLLEWLEQAAPDSYARILEADRLSAARLGHGNAIAMPYHHTILPLASRRDKRTEVRWGIADFQRRFGREPEGMWLPETAVDDETLDVVAEAGIRFTLLAPHQVVAAPPDGHPGLYTTRNGRQVAVAIYDGPLSHQVAFGPLIRDGRAWLDALTSRRPADLEPELITLATDGETYGHHHVYGEMALAAVVDGAEGAGLRLENLASFLARHPATQPVELVERTSWSCAHGVERWRSDCGCRLDPARFPSQKWRAPLREALDWLAGELHARFEQLAPGHLQDPWESRDALHGQPPGPTLPVPARELLEMERNALRMFTSCGWFFDDLAGIETLQCLRYAARAIELAGADGPRLREELAARLAAAHSNDPALGSGRSLMTTHVLPAVPAEARVAAGHAAVELFPWGVQERRGGAWQVEEEADGTLRLTDHRTGRTAQAQGSVRRGPEGALRFLIRLDGANEGHELGLADLPEAARATVRAALTAALFPSGLTGRLYEFGVAEREAVTERLIELRPGSDPALLHGALDLLTLLGEPVPFDAQTRFWRIMTDGGPVVRTALAPFIARFGFAPDAFSADPS